MKNTRLFIAAVLALVLALIILPAGADEAQRFGVVSNADTVNLRARATQDSTWLGSYDRGDWVSIHGESGNWYYVVGPDGKIGYMSKNFVTVSPIRYGSVGVVNNPQSTSFLNLRFSPSYSAGVIEIYYNGVPCVLLNSSNGWYHVRVDGVEGYFRQEYITRVSRAYSDEVATIVTPNNTGLNLRSGPGMDYSSIGQYRGGKYVMVLQKGNDWWRVSADGKVGFMSTEFLRDGILKPGTASGSTSTGSTSSGSSSAQGGYALVSNPKATQVLNLREQANTSSRVLGQYRNGAKVTVLAHGTEWCRVRTGDGKTGYMMTQYLSLHNYNGLSIMTVDHPQKTFVNLRARPSMISGAVLTRIPHGAKVTVLAPSSNGWVKVYYNGYTGYAVDYFLD